jgi:two-component system nitrogen regulation response regulator NtrX
MHPAVQAKVLRVLETGRVERVGGDAPVQVDVRVIAATNKDLLAEVAHQGFRQDLYFRLSVVTLHLPPLRERRGDIPPLACHFLRGIAAAYGRPALTFSELALEGLSRHAWPGNVRELRNAVERMVIFARGDRLEAADLPPLTPGHHAPLAASAAPITADGAPAHDAPADGAPTAPISETPSSVMPPTFEAFSEQAERRFLVEALRRHEWNVSRTADANEMPRSNLYKKLERYGISRE